MVCVTQGRFGPHASLLFASLVLSHFLVSEFQILADDVGTHGRLDEFGNFRPAYEGSQPMVDTIIPGEGLLRPCIRQGSLDDSVKACIITAYARASANAS